MAANLSGLGGLSPLSMPLGSGTSHTEDVYRAMRAAVGTSASPADGLDDLWRQSRAIGKAASQQSIDRAAFQALPEAATDHLGAYERGLALAFTAATNEQERRERITAAWTSQIVSTSRGVEIDLQAVSENYSVIALDSDLSDTVHHGRIYPPRGSESSKGTTQYPNWSSSFVVSVVYSLPAGEVAIPLDELDDGERALNNALPSWVDFVISQEGPSGAGFYADGGPDGTSVADLTAIYE